MTDAEELQWFRDRESLVRKLWFEALDERICECDECLARTDRLDVANAAVAVRDFDKSSPRSVKVGKRPTRPASRVRDPKSKGGESARREDVVTEDLVDGPGGLKLDRIASAEFVEADGEGLRLCCVCGRVCADISREAAEALGLTGATFMHPECEREVVP